MAESRNLDPMSGTVQVTVQGGGRRRRPATDKRRMQNRNAQRKYREKQVNRPRELELLAANIIDLSGQASENRLSSQLLPEISASSSHDLSGLSQRAQIAGEVNSVQSFTDDWIGSSLSLSTLDPGLGTSESGGDILPQISFNGIPETLFEFPGGDIMFSQADLPYETIYDSFQVRDSIFQAPSLDFSGTSESGINSVEKPNSVPSNVVSQVSEEILHSSAGKDASMSSMQLARRIAARGDPILVKTHSRGLANDIIAIERRRSVRDVILAGLQALEIRDTEELEVSSNASPRLPVLQRNNLCLVRTSTLQAYLSNARAIGMPIDELYRDTCPSPFYRPQANATEDMSVVLKSFSENIAPHLRPTSAQVLHSHHPWLDLIPFPTLRERAITLVSMNPPLLDAKELKLDVIMNDGLTCWHVSEKSGAHPWDMRSWEAAPWFLRKYWFLIGGEESEVWAQTKWWRGMRGEKQVDLRWDSS